jgi:threonine dehydrogenase-like Zn-dependent dehydrogenase
MITALALEAPRTIGFVSEEPPALGRGQVRIRTRFSGISAGTELTAYRGTNPYLHKRWDSERRLFISGDGAPSAPYPMVGWGYEEVGEIVELGEAVEDLAIGERVYGIWGHRESTVMDAEKARARVLPGAVPPIHGIFARIGEIALNGVLDAEIHLGETVAVFGMGVIGQVAAQLARLSGARVIAVDLEPGRLELARQLGADEAIAAEGAAEQIKALTGGRGADTCIEVSGASQALHQAIRACAYSSRVIAVGFYQGEPRGLLLGEEFHHNRIAVVCSQISGINPAIRHRWDADRLRTTFIDLVAAGRVALEPLVSHVAPFREAARLFELIDTSPADVMQAVLSFEGDQ